jgi:hypothetical protein
MNGSNNTTSNLDDLDVCVLFPPRNDDKTTVDIGLAIVQTCFNLFTAIAGCTGNLYAHIHNGHITLVHVDSKKCSISNCYSQMRIVNMLKVCHLHFASHDHPSYDRHSVGYDGRDGRVRVHHIIDVLW